MTGGSISGQRPTFETAADGAGAKGDDGSKKERKKREPKPPPKHRFYKSVDQVLSQPIIPASELPTLGLLACNTKRKRLEEKRLHPQRRKLPGCDRMVFYRSEDIIAHLKTLNDPRWNGTDAHYKALMAGRVNGGGNAT